MSKHRGVKWLRKGEDIPWMRKNYGEGGYSK